MRKIVLDTNILIDYEKGYANWLDGALENEQGVLGFILPTIVISEYFTSTIFENEELEKEADALMGLFIKQDFNEAIAKQLGVLLRRKTYPQSASTADLIIAATAIHLDAELATRNIADFASIPNLRLFDPETIKS